VAHRQHSKVEEEGQGRIQVPSEVISLDKELGAKLPKGLMANFAENLSGCGRPSVCGVISCVA